MAEIAAASLNAVVALHGSSAGWCAVAALHNARTALVAASWEFVSAAYLLKALKGHAQITSSQRAALQNVLARVPGMGKPPASRRDIDTALYVWARTLVAKTLAPRWSPWMGWNSSLLLCIGCPCYARFAGAMQSMIESH